MWFKTVSGKIVADIGEFSIDLGDKVLLSGPNGSGKTIILTMVKVMYELLAGKKPESLVDLVGTVSFDYWDHRYIEYHRMFDYFTIEMEDGLTATLAPLDDDDHRMYQYTCGDETVTFDVGKLDSMSTIARVSTRSVMIPQDRSCNYGQLLYNTLNHGVLLMDPIVKWYNFFITNERDRAKWKNPYASIPTWTDDDKPRAVYKKLNDWFDRLSHGEQELFLHQICLQNYDLVIIDLVEIGFHICVQEAYHEMLADYRPDGKYFLASTHSPSMLVGYRDRNVDLYEVKQEKAAE